MFLQLFLTLTFMSTIHGKVYMNASMDPFLTVKPTKNRSIPISMLVSMNYGGRVAFGPICSKTYDIVLEAMSENPVGFQAMTCLWNW